jgi:arabinogalactan oligomer/maltooligosaccharide transport system substrate-binding protein
MNLKTASIKVLAIVVIILVVALAASLMLLKPGVPQPSTSTTTSTTPSTTTQQPEEYVLKFGSIEVKVTRDIYELAQKAKNNEVDVTIEFWISMLPFEETLIKEVTSWFVQEYPGIKVDVVNKPSMKETFKASVIVGRGPDLLTWAHDWTGEFAEAELIVPVDEYLTDDIKNVYIDTALEAMQYQGQSWGFPWAAETVALVCNTEFVEEPPSSLDDLKNIMQQFYNPSQDMYGIAYQLDPYFISAWVHAYGGFYYNDETGEVGVGSQGTINGIKAYLEFIAPYVYKEDPSHEAQLRIFIEKKAPCMVTGPWDIPKIKEANITFTITPLSMLEYDYKLRPYSGVKMIWISKTAKDKGTDLAAALFALWFTLNDNVIEYLAKNAGFVPIHKIVLSKAEIRELPDVYAFSKAIEDSVPMPKSPEMAKVWGPVGEALNAIWTGEANVEDAMRIAHQNIMSKLMGG